MDILQRLLEDNPLFASLDKPVVERLIARAYPKRYSPGEILCMEGDPAAGLFICKSGWLKAARISPSGREQIIRYFGPGETFNEAGAIAEAPVPATITALKDSEVLMVPPESLLSLLEDETGLAAALCRMLAERVRYLVSLVENLSLKPVEARVAGYLLAAEVDGEVPRAAWLNHAELAARLGTVPDVLGRVLRNFEKAGLVSATRRTIRILDAGGLAGKIEGISD